jgi:hypothetical protein
VKPSPSPTQASGVTYRITTASSSYTDSAGNVWEADRYYSGGQLASTDSAIANTTADPLYQNERWGDFTYEFPEPNGTYNVTLKFAEIYWSAQGSRVFNVKLDGDQVLSNFDIFAEAGGANRAIDKTFQTTVTNGSLSLQFQTVTDAAKVDAIEIVPASGPLPSPSPSPKPSPSPSVKPSPTPSPSPTSGGALVPYGVSGNFDLTFDDEFNANSIDTSKWNLGNVNTWGTQQLNDELECYQAANSTESGGNLLLTAKKESVRCSVPSMTTSYSSGAVNTQAKFSQLYGYFEIRALMPLGQGLWPAFWLVPNNGQWPPEIDIFEFISNDPLDYQTIHWGTSDATHQESDGMFTVPDRSQNWNVYGLSWTPTSVTWYVNGQATMRYTKSANISNTPMFVILNMAVGGSWPGSPNSSTKFPSTMQVDYLRVWQCNDLSKCGN